MGRRPKKCEHTRLRSGCRSCSSLQKKWYSKLRKSGFFDIEYGLENARFTAHVVDPSTPGAQQKQDYYDQIWKVFHAWTSSGRTRRDCRVAELYASQEGSTGTVRGISRALKSEGLAPWSTSRVQMTLKEIRATAKDIPEQCNITLVKSLIYVRKRHAAA